jgi:hypothetical protein
MCASLPFIVGMPLKSDIDIPSREGRARVRGGEELQGVKC